MHKHPVPPVMKSAFGEGRCEAFKLTTVLWWGGGRWFNTFTSHNSITVGHDTKSCACQSILSPARTAHGLCLHRYVLLPVQNKEWENPAHAEHSRVPCAQSLRMHIRILTPWCLKMASQWDKGCSVQSSLLTARILHVIHVLHWKLGGCRRIPMKLHSSSSLTPKKWAYDSC